MMRVGISLGILASIPDICSTRIPRMVDLRSDSVTRPTEAMRSAMFNAEVGDDVLGDDPTVSLLESKLSLMFEKESALFFPSGTMSNLAATMSWCGKRGSEMILGDSSQMFVKEQGGISQLAGVLPRCLNNNQDGTISLGSIEKSIRQNNIHFPVTELVALEDTHNICGGRVLPKGYLEAVGTLTSSQNIKLHLDGARIWNAAIASQLSLSEIVKGTDSVTVSLSKGLGAPSGSLLLGPKDFIDRARRCRKVLGGGKQININKCWNNDIYLDLFIWIGGVVAMHPLIYEIVE
jgi:threonine aldolase